MRIITICYLLLLVGGSACAQNPPQASHESAANNIDAVTLAKGSTATLANTVSGTSSIVFGGSVDTSYDRITIPIANGEPADIGGEDLTVEIWLNASNQNTAGGAAFFNGNIFFDRDDLAGTRSLVFSLHGGRPQIYVQSGASGLQNANTDIRGGWAWLVFQRAQSGAVQVYVNGNREVNASLPGGDISFAPGGPPKNGVIELGGEKHVQGTPAYTGGMSEIRFSNTIRYSAATIAVPAAPLGVDADTVAYWSFSEGSGTLLADSASGQSNATVLFGGSPTAPEWSTDSPYTGASPGVVQFTAGAASVSEAETRLNVDVRRSGGASGAATVQLATSGGTATPGADYDNLTTQLAWADGEQGIRSAEVVLIPDGTVEPDETFTLTLNNATGAALGATTSQSVTILDNDTAGSAGTLAFTQSNFSVDENAGTASISVSREGGTTGAVTANFSTSPGTASAGADYTSVTRSVDFVDGRGGEQSVGVDIANDTLVENNETVQLSLAGANVGMPSSAVLTIVDDDNPMPQPGTLQFSMAAVGVNENAGSAELNVTRIGGSDGAISGNYATADGSASSGSDYQAANGSLNFADGDTAVQQITVNITDDTADEADETFQVTLSGAAVGSPAGVTVTISDNDDPTPPSPPSPPSSSSGGGAMGAFLGMLLAATLLLAFRRVRQRYPG
ncbi:MAG: Calx-beta domain-containing protein [Pseudomonadota bacterium]